MEYRRLGGSGLSVPALSFGTGTFGGKGEFFKAWGTTDATQARRLLDMCFDAGVNLFDTADIYSRGAAEEVLGEALRGRRDKALISAKSTFRMSDEPNDVGSSRFHLLRAVDATLQRLQTDYIDIFHLHGFDALTPVEEVLGTLDQLTRSGKVRYVGVSNFSGWHIMKSLACADRYGYPRYVSNQTYYSLLHRDYEWELMPLGLDQGIGAMIWSPLGWGRLTGKIGRGKPVPAQSRLHETADSGPPVDDEHLFKITDALESVASEIGKPVPQIALRWLLSRPSVSTVVLGARDEAQLEQNLATAQWELSREMIERLDRASEVTPPYPYWHQRQFQDRNPVPVALYNSD